MLVENAGKTGRELKSDKGYEIRGATLMYVITVKDRHALCSVHIRRSFTVALSISIIVHGSTSTFRDLSVRLHCGVTHIIIIIVISLYIFYSLC